MPDSRLVNAAIEARKNAYAPYSKFAVGAALLTKSGEIFSGCNIENISLGLTICAERAAVAAAVAHGQREFVAVAIATESKEPAVPCGACRQVLAEFNPAMKVISSTIEGRKETSTLADLLPRPKRGILGHV
jgi:cytidine deaminase